MGAPSNEYLQQFLRFAQGRQITTPLSVFLYTASLAALQSRWEEHFFLTSIYDKTLKHEAGLIAQGDCVLVTPVNAAAAVLIHHSFIYEIYVQVECN